MNLASRICAVTSISALVMLAGSATAFADGDEAEDSNSVAEIIDDVTENEIVKDVDVENNEILEDTDVLNDIDVIDNSDNTTTTTNEDNSSNTTLLELPAGSSSEECSNECEAEQPAAETPVTAPEDCTVCPEVGEEFVSDEEEFSKEEFSKEEFSKEEPVTTSTPITVICECEIADSECVEGGQARGETIKIVYRETVRTSVATPVYNYYYRGEANNYGDEIRNVGVAPKPDTYTYSLPVTH